MNRITEFVITGGPCAGKTTALSTLKQFFTKLGYKVIIVPETATEVIMSGILPGETSIADFQEVIINRSINKEETTRKIAKKIVELTEKNVIIFYDRGILDSLAYMPKSIFESILSNNNLTLHTVRDKYDAVFHLVTAADGAENFYTLQNNQARFETPKEARIADSNTRNAWVGHKHLRIIDNSTDFEGKIKRLLQQISSVLEEHLPIESTVRKFLIFRPNLTTLPKYTHIRINQTYLSTTYSGTERRIRTRNSDGDCNYFYSEKNPLTNRFDKERIINKDEYNSLLLEGERSLEKDRYCFCYENQYFELDIFDKDNLSILSIEQYEEGKEVLIPDFINVKKEVTGDPKYLNSNLAKIEILQ